LDQLAPTAWKQRDAAGNPALTGWSPPSTLLSPANVQAMAYLQAVAGDFVGIAVAAGQAPRFQVGEPWWWVGSNDAPCFYDAATVAAYAVETGLPVPAPMSDVRVPVTAAQRAFMDWLGVALGRSTLALRDAVRAAVPSTQALLLFYAPQLLRTDAPDLQRANLPAAWAFPAWDVLQLEDYDFVTGRDFAGQRLARAAATQSLGYPVSAQHYFSGFVLAAEDRSQWQEIDAAIAGARDRGVAEVFVWAWPQVARDGFTAFELSGDETMPAFHDILFPLELGFGAAGGPQFSTQVAIMASGFEQRNSSWADARLHYDAGVGVRSEADLAALIRFFRARRGQAHGFRFRDPLDHSSRDDDSAPTPLDQLIGVADGVRTRFDLSKTYGDDEPQLRRISRPVAGSIRVAVNGSERLTGWSVAAGGSIDFDQPPAVGAP
ncbi:MAG: phage distal tail protein, Rcc01695 family, partial [Polymorphobacter sp.]